MDHSNLNDHDASESDPLDNEIIWEYVLDEHANEDAFLYT